MLMARALKAVSGNQLGIDSTDRGGLGRAPWNSLAGDPEIGRPSWTQRVSWTTYPVFRSRSPQGGEGSNTSARTGFELPVDGRDRHEGSDRESAAETALERSGWPARAGRRVQRPRSG